MGFLDPSKLQEDDALPGGSGLHLDLDTKACPACHREALPWQTECEDCGVPTVVRADVPVPEFELPNLAPDDIEDDTEDEPTGGADPEATEE